jgi:hypothetical protein
MGTSTLTPADEAKIADYLKGRHIPRGLGDREAACSIAAINIALSGRVTDMVPDCMSPVVGRWIISVQDRMPDEMRNSDTWRNLLPRAAGTGRDLEDERLAIILDWMVDVVLTDLQSFATDRGFGTEWAAMLSTPRPWRGAAGAAWAAWAAWAAEAAGAAGAAEAAWAAEAARAAGAARAAEAARAARAAEAARAAGAAAWDRFDPCGLLERLITAEPVTEATA